MEGDPASRFRAGDREVISEVHAAIIAVARRFRRNATGPLDDIVREVQGRVFLSLAAGRFRGEASLLTLARSVAKHTCLERARRHRASVAANTCEVGAAATPTPEQVLLRDEQLREGLRALSELPADDVRLVRLLFVELRPYREAAHDLGLSEPALRVRLHRCRARLARTLGARTR